MSARSSQIGAMAEGMAGNTKLSSFFQVDFEMQGLASNYQTSNGWTPRLRHFWGQAELPNGFSVLAGQAFSLLRPNRKLIAVGTEWGPVTEDQGTMVRTHPTVSRSSASHITSLAARLRSPYHSKVLKQSSAAATFLTP
jgi:hypothetical protein